MLFQIEISATSSSLVVPFSRAMQCCSDGSESPRYEQTKYSDRQVEKRQRERAHMAGIIPETQAPLSGWHGKRGNRRLIKETS